MTEFNTIQVPINKLEVNRGQIEGLPKNPRFIKDERFQKLVKSIQDDPEMLSLRELIVYPIENNKYVVIAGNMRFKAMQELGFKTAPCKELPHETPLEKLKAYIIKDNVPFGDNDWSALAEEWDAEELADWGLVETGFEYNSDNTDYSEKNKEIDVNDLDAPMVINLKYTEEEYWKVKEALARIAETPEQAVWKLLQ